MITRNLLTCFISKLNCTILRPHLKGNFDFKPFILSFDDGPNQIDDTTLDLLAVLKNHNVKVFFCLIGENVKQFPHIVKQIYLDGHILVNNGNTAEIFVLKKFKDLPADVKACNQSISGAVADVSFKVDYFRPGWGVYRSKHKTIWEETNMTLLPVTDFHFDHLVAHPNKERFTANFIKRVKHNHGGIYVFHDGRNIHSKIEKKVREAKTKNAHTNYDRTWVPTVVDRVLTELKKEGFHLPALNDGLPNKLSDEFNAFLFDGK
jgi:peptidoglycan/xylan/chitin deacetylase (PgdA/CDA1 family)